MAIRHLAIRIKVETIGRYQLIEEIGHGGMGTVYRANDTLLGREVALKLLPAHLSQEQTFSQRFQRTAQIVAARLQHPHIVPIYDFGTQEGQPFITMPLLMGGTLGQRIEQFPIPPDELWPILKQIAMALDMAHSQQVVHRDIKPNNILFDTHNNAFVSDFGIARAMDSHTHLTGNAIIGSPAYMSPEQFKGSEVDGRSDQYSLAIVVYEALTGRLPFIGDTAHIMYQHLQAEPPLLPITVNLPPQVSAVLHRALAKNPHERFDSTSQFVDAVITASHTHSALSQAEPAFLPYNQPAPATSDVKPVDNPKPSERPHPESPLSQASLKPDADTSSHPSVTTHSQRSYAPEPPSQQPPVNPVNQGTGLKDRIVTNKKWLIPVAIVGGILLIMLFFLLLWPGGNSDQTTALTDTPQATPEIPATIAATTAVTPEPAATEPMVVSLSISPGPGGLAWQTGEGEQSLIATVADITFRPEQRLRLDNGQGITAVTLPDNTQLFLDNHTSITLQTLSGINGALHTKIQVQQGTFLIASQPESIDIEVTTGDKAVVGENGRLIISYREAPFWFQADCLQGECQFIPQGGASANLVTGDSICIYGESCQVSGRIIPIAYEQFTNLASIIEVPPVTPVATSTMATTTPATANIPQVRVTTSSANVRQGPGTVYSGVGVVRQGDVFEVIARNNDATWYLINLNTTTRAWLAASVTEPIGGSLLNIPIAATIPPRPTATATRTPLPLPTNPPPPPQSTNTPKPPPTNPPPPPPTPTPLPPCSYPYC